MSVWFQRLPIHRKLVVLALLVTAVALSIAMVGLAVLDIWRIRTTAADDADALARVLAENSSAAVAFDDPDAAGEILRSVRVRDVVVRACLYRTDGTLFAQYARPGTPACPPGLAPAESFAMAYGVATVVWNARTYGRIYVERDLSDLSRRLWMTVLGGIGVFFAAGLGAFFVARRTHRAVVSPIVTLAAFARRFGADDQAETRPPPLRTAPDEVGDLVASFGEMVERVHAANEATRRANEELQRSNEALRQENEERLRSEREREGALAREREANRLKDEFLAAVSHELRTPLNAMMGWAQVLGTNPPEETVRKAVTSIVRNARAQTRVVEDLIDISRIVTGKMRLSPEPSDLCGILTQAIETIQPSADLKRVQLVRRLPEGECLVMGDRDRLQQVFWNLLSNAIKFSPEGATVTIEGVKQDGRYAVSVADQGRGIDASFLPHVFERFRQADGSMTREVGGLGLGLAIVKELTELHGGTATASSEGLGRGATFTVTLPALDGAGGERLSRLGGTRAATVEPLVRRPGAD
jgi:signal transduction histidine kinase